MLNHTTQDRVPASGSNRYFAELPPVRIHYLAIALFTAAAVTAAVGLFVCLDGAPKTGLAVLVIGGALAYLGYQREDNYAKARRTFAGRPDDRDMDRELASHLTTVRRRAMQRLGVTLDDLENLTPWDPIAALESGDPSATSTSTGPLLVFGPLLSARSAIGADRVRRFTGYEVMVICPTSRHLAIYRCKLDALTGTILAEDDQEYRYADIVTVYAVNAEQPWPQTYPPTMVRYFQIVPCTGDRSSIIVGITDGVQAPLQPSGIDETISTIRQLLRDKKR